MIKPKFIKHCPNCGRKLRILENAPVIEGWRIRAVCMNNKCGYQNRERI